MFEVTVNQEKQKYRSKPTMDVDISGSSASIPKPLTYDYMPEGYPSKSIRTVTLMEEQEVTFTENGGRYQAIAPVKIDISEGQTYTVVWDGVEYSCVGHVADVPSYIGNPAAFGGAESTGEPFLYANASQPTWVSYDTATSHTISVTTQGTVYKTIDKKFLPEAGKFVVYEITETWDSHGNSIYSCELSFNDAYAMEEQKLQKSIKYATVNPSVVRKTKTSKLGKVIALKFESYIPNSDMTVTVSETLFIWNSNGLHKATRKTS